MNRFAGRSVLQVLVVSQEGEDNCQNSLAGIMGDLTLT